MHDPICRLLGDHTFLHGLLHRLGEYIPLGKREIVTPHTRRSVFSVQRPDKSVGRFLVDSALPHCLPHRISQRVRSLPGEGPGVVPHGDHHFACLFRTPLVEHPHDLVRRFLVDSALLHCLSQGIGQRVRSLVRKGPEIVRRRDYCDAFRLCQDGARSHHACQEHRDQPSPDPYSSLRHLSSFLVFFERGNHEVEDHVHPDKQPS